MISFSVGTNWDLSLIDAAHELNQQNKIRQGIYYCISSFYGSIPKTVLASARPNWRLCGNFAGLKTFIEKAHKVNIGIDYTANAFCLGDYSTDLKCLGGLLSLLEDLGVDRIIVAHPVIAEAVLLYTSRMKIGLSTILNIDDVRSIEVWREFLKSKRFDQVCVALEANRDPHFLRFATVFREKGIELQLMVNEFCSVNGPCHGIFRDSCYMGHSHGIKDVCDNYPMSRCTNIRTKNPVSWLKAPFILPSWVKDYNEKLYIDSFKITGRTANTDYIKQMMTYYMTKTNPENLLELWPQLETIYTPNLTSERARESYPTIPTTYLLHFHLPWVRFSLPKKSFSCRHTLCDVCGYCKETLDLIQLNQRG